MQSPQGPLAIVDLETTGPQPASNRIAEIGGVEVGGFQLKQIRKSIRLRSPVAS